MRLTFRRYPPCFLDDPIIRRPILFGFSTIMDFFGTSLPSPEMFAQRRLRSPGCFVEDDRGVGLDAPGSAPLNESA